MIRHPRQPLGGPAAPRKRIVLALEGAVAPMSCFVDDSEEGRVLCSHLDDHGHGCATKLLWTRVQGSIVRTLNDMTLADIAKPARTRPEKATTTV